VPPRLHQGAVEDMSWHAVKETILLILALAWAGFLVLVLSELNV